MGTWAGAGRGRCTRVVVEERRQERVVDDHFRVCCCCGLRHGERQGSNDFMRSRDARFKHAVYLKIYIFIPE